MKNVENKRMDLEHDIKVAEEKLETIYPADLRVIAQDYRKNAAQSAISIIASSGQVDPVQLKHLTSLLNKASEDEMKEDEEDEDDDEKEKKKDQADDRPIKRHDFSNIGGTRSAK